MRFRILKIHSLSTQIQQKEKYFCQVRYQFGWSTLAAGSRFHGPKAYFGEFRKMRLALKNLFLDFSCLLFFFPPSNSRLSKKQTNTLKSPSDTWDCPPDNITNLSGRQVWSGALRTPRTGPDGHRTFQPWNYLFGFCFFGLLYRHTAINPITSETHTSGAQ